MVRVHFEDLTCFAMHMQVYLKAAIEGGLEWKHETVRRKMRALLMEWDASHPGPQVLCCCSGCLVKNVCKGEILARGLKACPCHWGLCSVFSEHFIVTQVLWQTFERRGNVMMRAGGICAQVDREAAGRGGGQLLAVPHDLGAELGGQRAGARALQAHWRCVGGLLKNNPWPPCLSAWSTSTVVRHTVIGQDAEGDRAALAGESDVKITPEHRALRLATVRQFWPALLAAHTAKRATAEAKARKAAERKCAPHLTGYLTHRSCLSY